MDYTSKNHIGWLVPSINKALPFFYSIGFDANSQIINDPNRKINIIFLHKVNQVIELIEPSDKTSIVYSYLKRHGPGPYHICIRQDDFISAEKTIKNLNFVAITREEEAIAFDNSKVQFFYSNDVGMVEISF